MLGVYFSGTGNTKYCIEYFLNEYDQNSNCLSIEDDSVLNELAKQETIVLGYPVYYSNMPKIVQDFLKNNQTVFAKKKVYVLATMGLFSGDGAGCAARLLKNYGAEILGGLHLKMPDNIGDVKLLKKSLEANQAIISAAEKKIKQAAANLTKHKPDQDGLGIHYQLAGLLGQRLWFYNKTANYHAKPRVDSNKCIGCKKCSQLCPMNNIEIVEGRAVSHDQCTLCYRCFSYCPKQALTILGKEVHEQWIFAKQ